MPQGRAAWLLPEVCLLAVLACSGDEGGHSGPAITVSTVDGLTTVTHTQAALERVPTVRPGALVLTLGGPDADEDHDATPMTDGWLVADGFITLQQTELTLRRYDSTGAVVARLGSRGEGPDEFQSLTVSRMAADSLVLVDAILERTFRTGTDLAPQQAVRFASGRSMRLPQLMALDAGLLGLQTHHDSIAAGRGAVYRVPIDLYVLRDGSASWDSVLRIRGDLVHADRTTRDGVASPTRGEVVFGPSPLIASWRDRIAVVDNGDRTIDVYGPDGSLRIHSVAAWPIRPVTTAVREARIAADLSSIAQWKDAPDVHTPLVAKIRGQRFADSVAPYDRILAARDGSLWLRENVTPLDTVEYEWLAFGRDGQLVRRLITPARVQLLDIDRDRVLLRRTDDDGTGYIELRQLKGGAP